MSAAVCMFAADHRHTELRVALHFYAKYWNWPLTVFGFKQPPFGLESNVEFISLGDMRDYPAEKWSNAVIRAMQMVPDEMVIVLLEDYWLTRYVNKEAITQLCDYMLYHPEVVRGDLTTDRLYAENLVDLGPWGMLDIIENDPPAQYHFSTQAGIWRKEHLLYYLNPGETPWQTELEGTTRMQNAHRDNDYPYRVVGTRQCPVRYLIAIQGDKLALDGGYQSPTIVMLDEDKRTALDIMGMAK